MSKADIETIKQEISSFLKESLKGFVGQVVDKKKVEDALLAMLENMEKENRLPKELEKYNQVASDLLAATFLGFQEGFDPKPLLRELPTHLLIMLRESFPAAHGFPLNVIWLEIFYREDKLVDDWAFERISQTEAKLNFQLKQAMNYLALTMSINEEKKN